MTDKTPQQIKEQALAMLAEATERQRTQLMEIDPRLVIYYDGLLDGDYHNVYEILGGLKFLRKLRTYRFSRKRVRHAIRLYEGEWRNGEHVPDSGGLRFSGLRGFAHYELQPFQVFAIAGVLGLIHEVDGDKRRLCTELVLFLTRKSGKTLMAAFFQFYGFFFMDNNFEGYCCANSSDQAKLLYKNAQNLIRQLDVTEQRIRFTASQTNWKPGQPRQASITALSAGGKTKDGLFAQLCCADEFGSADFVNGKSDMLDLVNVVQSSMGPRREPLTIITTTAGYALNGPFHRQLEIMQQALEEEITLPLDYCEPRRDDYQHALLLQPDPWEQGDEEALLTDERIWRKANPMIGISVQPSFYEQEAYKARQNPDQRKEFITKLVNVYESNKVNEWIKAAEIRPLQRDMRIDDCTADQGWVVLCGMDFSKGDDLHNSTYLAVRATDHGTEFFADLDAWITEKALQESGIRSLYEAWIERGWLHVCPGAVLQPSLPINRMIDLIDNKGVSFIRWGYDSYQSKDPINTLKAYLWDMKGVNPDQYVVPVSQTYASYNPAVLKIEACVWSNPPLLTFSNNPMWPWEFGNCVVDEDSRMNNRKMIKRNPGSDACKVDSVQSLATCFILLDQIDGSIMTT